MSEGNEPDKANWTWSSLAKPHEGQGTRVMALKNMMRKGLQV